jgi:capsular polysaccharide biosynthesis protein
VELNDKGFDNALFITNASQISERTVALSELIFGKHSRISYSADLADPVSISPVCFEKAVILGKSINLFSRTWDAARFREVVTAQLGVTFKKEFITLCLRRTTRKLVNHKALVDLLLSKGRGLLVKVGYLEYLTFVEQVSLMARTAVLVAVHGAGLTNSIFLPPGAAVLEISPFGFNYRAHFHQCGTVLCSLRYIIQRNRQYKERTHSAI